MKLGHAFEFDIPVDDVARSSKFYEQLGFEKVPGSDTDPAQRWSDGLIVVALRRNGGQRAGLTYFTEDLDASLRDLRTLGITGRRGEAGQRPPRATFVDPDQHRLTLAVRPPAVTPRSPGRARSKLGEFGELSLEVADVDRSAAFWRALGFEPTPYSPGAGAGWESLRDQLLMVGIYAKGQCQHPFRSPVITYFNEDSAQRIKRVKAEGITLVHEMAGPGGATSQAVAQAPDGQMLFLFSAG